MHTRRAKQGLSLALASAPRIVPLVRMDSAFFSDEIVGNLDTAGVEYTTGLSNRYCCIGRAGR